MGESILSHRRKPPLDTSAINTHDEARRGQAKGNPVLIPELRSWGLLWHSLSPSRKTSTNLEISARGAGKSCLFWLTELSAL